MQEQGQDEKMTTERVFSFLICGVVLKSTVFPAWQAMLGVEYSCIRRVHPSYLEEEEVYLVTALVPSETACLASSPGSRSLTAVWTSLEEMVLRLL